MNKYDFHIPFIKSLVVVILFTICGMVCSHYAVNYYMNTLNFNNKSTNYAVQTSQNEMNH